MIIFKFGGASVKDADSIRNLAEILKEFKDQRLFVVVSAMGKTTNFLESIADLGYKEVSEGLSPLHQFHEQHITIGKELGLTRFDQLDAWLEELRVHVSNSSVNFNEYYDQIIPYGELYSTSIIADFLRQELSNITWLDARKMIITNSDFRNAQVDWEKTSRNIGAMDLGDNMYITQGFIGSSEIGHMSTLGREGSDYTAAIFGNCLNAEEVIFWKDVPGIMNADPKLFPQSEKFERLSYQEATEMTYYGAKVIHPKTLKPLAHKGIPLKVKSFIHPAGIGTVIADESGEEYLPTYVFRPNQVLLTLKSRSNEFTDEKLLIEILTVLDDIGVRLNMMQRSALSFSFSTDDEDGIIEAIHRECQGAFEVYHNQGLHLATVKNFNQKSLKLLPKAKEILLEQITRFNYQRLYRA